MFYRCFTESSVPLSIEDRYILETFVASGVLVEMEEDPTLACPAEMTRRLLSCLEEMGIRGADFPLECGWEETIAWLAEQGEAIVSFVAGSRPETRHREILGDVLHDHAPKLLEAVERMRRFEATRGEDAPEHESSQGRIEGGD